MKNRRCAASCRITNAAARSWPACATICTVVFTALAGGPPAAAPSSPPSADAFQRDISKVARLFQGSPRLRKLSQTAREDLVKFVIGNVVFVMLHELAHAMVADLAIPMLGPEEDAADYFAIVELLHLATTFSHRVLVDAAEGWFLSHRRNQFEREPLYFHDEHGLDKQRAYKIVCIMVGSDPIKFKDLARDSKLPEGRQRSCRNDYDKAVSGWNLVLEAHRRSARQPKAEIEVNYGSGNGKYDMLAEAMRSLHLLEIADGISDELAWPRPLALEMKSCGYINAAWFAQTRKVIVCYELVDDFMHLYRDYGHALTFVSQKQSSK